MACATQFQPKVEYSKNPILYSKVVSARTQCQHKRSVTHAPSNVPSNVPSSVPSHDPSNVPSNDPSNVPWNVASNVSSNVPWNVASNVPSNVVLNVPSNVLSNVDRPRLAAVPSRGGRDAAATTARLQAPRPVSAYRIMYYNTLVIINWKS